MDSIRKPFPRHLLAGATTVVLAAACTAFAPAHAQTLEESSRSNPPALVKAMQDSREAYRARQFRRLAQRTDRDSLVAAVFLGMPGIGGRAMLEGEGEVEDRLARSYGRDSLALFALALSCQMQHEPCAHPDRYDALVRLQPDNAVNWLLLPNGAAPDAAQLHAAADAAHADSHLRDMLRIVRAALAGQPAPEAAPGVDAKALAQLLRRDAADQVPLPAFHGVIAQCKADVAKHPADCIALAHRLIEDRSGAILTRMIGVVLLRRLEKGSPDDLAARAMRRQYVWLGEQLEATAQPYQERLQDEMVAYGEWEAVQRAVERLGASRTPPADWIPKHPQSLLMSEERTPAASN